MRRAKFAAPGGHSTGGTVADEEEAPRRARDRRQAGTDRDDRRGWIWLLALVELGGIVLLATGRGETYRGFLGILGAALLIAVAAISAGGVLGLLFALPRTAAADGSRSTLAGLADWLPLLVIGAALVDAKDLVGWVGAQGARTGAALGLGGEAGSVIGAAIVGFNALFGFLAFFIYVRPGERADTAPPPLPASAAAPASGPAPDAALRAATRAASILGALYQPPPGGYEQAIREARAFLRNPANERNATIWMYLACAYGQKHADLQMTATGAELGRLAQGAIDAVRRARRYDPDLKDAMRALWDPNDENHIEGENDLQSFHDNARLRELFADELL